MDDLVMADLKNREQWLMDDLVMADFERHGKVILFLL